MAYRSDDVKSLAPLKDLLGGNLVRILMVGDVIGQPGRNAIKALLPDLIDEYNIDLTVLNGENAAGGFGITSGIAQELFDYGVDVITSGNHIWDQREIIPHLDGHLPIIRLSLIHI